MTEREKSIEIKDLAQLMRSYCHDKIPDCNSNRDCEECMEKLVIDTGYRKEEEVQKETASRFLTIINGLLDDVENGTIENLEELRLQLIYNVHFLRKEIQAWRYGIHLV